jgi:hypothetical protein
MTVQLPVQLPCNLRATSVSATPRLPISKLHACTRAARLLHGIGSRKRRIDLVSCGGVCIFNPEPSGHQFHRDQQSETLLASTDIRIGFTRLFAFHDHRIHWWECHGKMALLFDLSDLGRNAEYAWSAWVWRALKGGWVPGGASSGQRPDNRRRPSGARSLPEKGGLPIPARRGLEKLGGLWPEIR